MRTPASWKKMIEDKTPYQIAQVAIADLIGYRQTSLKRTEDTDNLTNLITLLMAPEKLEVGDKS